ncbi:hypothetical protein E3N88_13725 [Mikania micrantha]|uniref:CCHC-type domain-containing protein n=1 Tax=Mikania micrantha TaxID=192012 RepID=A0A5N6P2G6_9ASTR|nr:hypothetical protein E3N88_13725 [Mikania micrantha]
MNTPCDTMCAGFIIAFVSIHKQSKIENPITSPASIHVSSSLFIPSNVPPPSQLDSVPALSPPPSNRNANGQQQSTMVVGYNQLTSISQHDMKMDESISVSSIIDKLPPSWKNFKHTLIHQKKDLNLFNKLKDKKRKFNNDNNHSNKKVKKTCWRCGKPGHFKKDCRVKLSGGNKADAAGPSGSKDPNVKPG